MIDPINSQPNFPELEKNLVEHWKKNKIFEKSVEMRPEDRKWTFLDGPPFITGMPHYGTLLSSLPKDVFPRFWTMKGYKVRRVWGWDCHGLPAENKVENKLGLKRKKDIEEVVGIKKFIDECKLYVSEVSGEWEWYIDHIARWVDFKNAYKTMDMDYMESVMWVFKQMYEKDYIYKGLRVSLYCPHCSTPISNFEVAMDSENYKDVTDSGTIYKFRLKEDSKTFLLAWSTTPWTKITTSALAVNPDLTYVYAQVGDDTYVLAESTLEILKADYKITKKITGAELAGTEFEPHFNYYDIDEGKKAFIVAADNYVTADEGTGVVTLAPYGEDDLRVMKAQNIHIEMHLDDEGHMIDKVPHYGGMYYLKANKLINADLAENGLIYRDEPYTHSMPHCWRCGTLLYYAPQDAWYVDIQKLKPQLFKNNEKINWYPNHFKYGRFLKSMEAAPDWCISRSRYWGSPVPVWECECGDIFVPGSIEELENASGTKIKELHRPEIDDVVVACVSCGKEARRVPEVLDSWIEAGSASFAERHFPFDKNINLEDFFPPDFIVEYTGQIRAWFYVLHVIGTALFDSNSFKNVAVTGVILGTDGRKMSKNFGNYPDPRMMLEKYGGDALRLYLMGSPVMRGEDIIISEEDYRNQIKSFHIPLWNIFKFFLLYAQLDNYEIKEKVEPSLTNILDKWMVNLLSQLRAEVTKDLEAYDTVSAIKKIIQFVDDASKWYVRRSRDRIGLAAHNAEDKQAFYDTMLYVLREFSKISAPITPFISESIFTHITKEESVHLQDWPNEQMLDNDLLHNMDIVRKLVESGHRIRKEKQLKVRQPLASVTLITTEKFHLKKDEDYEQYLELIKDELNVKEVLFKKVMIFRLNMIQNLLKSFKKKEKHVNLLDKFNSNEE
jgi:isoleucyl-tRNA synthetase